MLKQQVKDAKRTPILKIRLLYRMHSRSCTLVVAWSCRPQLAPRRLRQWSLSLVRRFSDLCKARQARYTAIVLLALNMISEGSFCGHRPDIKHETLLLATGGTSAALRFTAAVVDLAPDAAARAVRDCGVFIVPQVQLASGA